MLGQQVDVGIAAGLVLGAAACWVNARTSGKQRENDPGRDGRRQQGVQAVHQPAVAG
jgi:hypothetical protein